jgi:hypothetical protein
MTTTEPADGDALERRYFTSLEVSRLREQVYRRPVSTVPSADLTDLVRAEAELAALSRAAAGAVAGRRGTYELRGGDTTGLEATVEVHMSEVPTAAYHLLDAADQPLLTVRVHNAGEDRRRVRVTSFLDGYSARAVDTAEVERGDCRQRFSTGYGTSPRSPRRRSTCWSRTWTARSSCTGRPPYGCCPGRPRRWRCTIRRRGGGSISAVT